MKYNIIANFFGRIWSLLSAFLFIPFYIKYLGFESYSIISFTLVIASLMAILDSGLTSTLSREFARNDIFINEKERIFNALESIYLLIAGFVIILASSFSDSIALYWVNSSVYNAKEIAFFLKILGIEVGFQMLFKFYLGGLFGFEKQIKANFIQIGWGVFRNGVVVCIIIFIPTLEYFFYWQALITVITVFVTRRILVRQFSQSFSFKFGFEKSVYQKIWHFALGMFLISIVSGINTQIDKIMISKLLSVENLGYYTISISLAMGLLALTSPFSTALLPRFTAMYSIGDKNNSTKIFVRYSKFIVIIVFSAMANMIFFSKSIIWAWTGNMDIALNSGVFLPPIAFSYAMLAIVTIYFNVAIANGYTLLNNILGIVSLLITVPGYWYAVKLYGALGVAWVFLAVQFLTTMIYIYVISKKFLINVSVWNLYIKNLLFPIAITLVIAYLFLYFGNNFYEDNRFLSFLYIGVSVLITFIITYLLLMPKNTLKKILSLKI